MFLNRSRTAGARAVSRHRSRQPHAPTPFPSHPCNTPHPPNPQRSPHFPAPRMAPRLRTSDATMKLRRLDSPTDEPARTARVVRDPHNGCFVLLGRHALRASDHELHRYEVTSATDAERDALLRARTRLRGLRPRLVPVSHKDFLPHAR